MNRNSLFGCNLATLGQLFPAFAIGVVGIGDNDESTGIGFANDLLHTGDFLVVDDEEEHLLVAIGIEALAADAGGRTLEVLEDVGTQFGHRLLADDEEELVVLVTGNHTGDDS